MASRTIRFPDGVCERAEALGVDVERFCTESLRAIVAAMEENVKTTVDQIERVRWWETITGLVICFKVIRDRVVAWRCAGEQGGWEFTDCPQPLKPRGTTWTALDLEAVRGVS